MKRSSLLSTVAFAALSLLPGVAPMSAADTSAGAGAVQPIETVVTAREVKPDEAAYMKALALFQAKQYAEAIGAADKVAADFPASDWRFKASFLKAQTLIEVKKYAEAAVIYESESARIFSPARKQELVGAIVRFAEKLTAKPDPNVPDAPKPDFAKAYKLYGKALAMEISRELRDEITFQKARALQQAGNAAGAANEYRAYLTEFDPTWTGAAGSGSPRLPMQNPPPPGKHGPAARYRLAECLIGAGTPVLARMELEDLLKLVSAMAPKDQTEEVRALPAEIRWQMVLSYFQKIEPQDGSTSNNTSAPIGNRGGLPMEDAQLYRVTEGEIDQAVKVARAYLEAFPAGSRATRTAWMIAEAYTNRARIDDAIAAYRDVIAGKGFTVPAGEAANKFDEELQATPANHYLNLKMRALNRIGQLLAAQKKREEAIAIWQQYIKDYPNGAQWSECQEAIINAEYLLGLDALADKKEPLALQRFEDFLRAHPLDPRAPRILYIFGAIHEAKALELSDAKGAKADTEASYREAIEEWAKLVSKYPQSAEARIAMMHSGSILEEKLGEFEKALQLYRKLAHEFGVGEAQQAEARLTEKVFTLTAEKTFRTNEPAVVHLKSRNLEKATVRIYKIDLQAYFRKTHGITGVEALDVSLIQPDKTWEFKPAKYEKYRLLENDIEIPFPANESGAYVVTVGDDTLESTVLVSRSNLEMIVKSSRREVFAFVQDMLTGKPAAGADVLVSNDDAVVATGKTGADGVFKAAVDSLKEQKNVRVFASLHGHAAAFQLNLDGLELSDGLLPTGYIYTDRPAYLPGETVAVRGILRDVKNGSYAVPGNPEFVVSFTDPEGRLLSEQKVKLGKFGTFDTTLVLPNAAGLGEYVVAAKQERKGQDALEFQGAFNVREFKLEKIKLSLEFPRRVYFRGEAIEASFLANYYWGEPLANRTLRCIKPDGRSETLTTDAEGKAKLTFDTTGMTPGSVLRFSASLDGENVTATENISLARFGFSIEAGPSQPVVLAGEPFDLELATKAADGKPSGETLKVTVARIERTKPSRVLTLLPWAEITLQSTAETKVSEVEAKTDATSGKVRVPFKLEPGGHYQFRVSGTDRLAQIITTETSIEVSGSDDETKLRIFSESASLKVGEEAKVRLHSRLEKGLALLTYEGETILRYQILELKKDENPLTLAVGHDLFPNFRLAVTTIDGREIREAAKEFKVERELKVSLKPAKEAFLPGEEGSVAVTVTDQMGKPVEAELSLALVNEALYAVAPDPETPILDFFQENAVRHAEFKAGATCGFRYPGQTRAVSSDVTEETKRLVRMADELHVAQTESASHAFFMTAQANAPEQNLFGATRAQIVDANSPMAGRPMSGRAFGGGLGYARGGAPGASQPNLPPADKPAPSLDPAGRAQAAAANPAPEAAPRLELQSESRWLPSVITGADGQATATLKMPETTTAWQLTARGCTVETLVGEAVGHTLTRKDFFVDLKTPNFLREGDALRPVARVHNLTDYAGPVSLSLQILDAKDRTKVLAKREKNVAVTAKGGAEVTFEAVQIPASLEVVLEVKAAAGAQTDALALTIPVKPWGLPYVAQGGGSAEADGAVVLGLPAGRAYSSAWLAVSVGPDVRSAILEMALRQPGAAEGEALARMAPAPWGEHAGNELLSVASALIYANAGKADESYARQLSARARALVANLVASQGKDGSWTSPANAHLTTARAYWALIQARQAGLAVHKDTIEKAAVYLQKQFESADSSDADTKAVILHALSTDKRADFANCNRLYRERNALSNASLAFLASAFFNLERKEIATELAGLLETRVKIEAAAPVRWESGYKAAWLNDADETTAMVLLALAETKPDDAATKSAAQYLLQQHGCFGFATARARGPAVAALAAWFGKGKEIATDTEITVEVNGKEIGTVKAHGAQGLTLLPVPAATVKADKNVIEFKMKGRGRYAYLATLYGFSADTKQTDRNVNPRIDQSDYLHAQLEYRGRPIAATSTSPVKNAENGQRVVVQMVDRQNFYFGGRHFVLEIPLPAGARLVEGSLNVQRALSYEVKESSIVVYSKDQSPIVSYQLAGYAPGKYRILPPVIRELGNPAFMSIGPTSELTVLAAGEKSPDAYVLNDAERFALGQCYFNDGDYGSALENLAAVFKSNPKHNESELARMLLWIYTTPKFYDAHRIVDMFEVLRERYPTLEVPFDRILVVGKAYRDIGEHERAWLVYRAAISASFANDAGISAVLEDEGRFLGSIDFQQKLWREYPDTAEVVSSYFAISQLVYQRAPKAHELPKEDGVQPEKIAMLKRTADLLVSFLAMYPADPLADDAAFSLANCMLDLKDYPTVVRLATSYTKRFADSPLAPSFQYLTALGLFWQNKYGEALASAKVVADGDSKDRDFARYILGQIYHAQSKPAEAIDWYSKVKELYPDAASAISYFEAKRIALEEITVVKPGAAVSLNLKYRNIKEAFVQVYRVDLMKLYLQQKNLSAITSVQLAGIRPELEQTIALGDGKDYTEKERKLDLKLKDEAAYLVICRGDDLFTSGMVLITPLKIEVQEDATSGQVRANVLDTVKGGYRPEVHVKAIGSADHEFRSGETDLRGLYVADRLRGKATVIAREGESRYAFFRGDQWLGAPQQAPAAPAAQPAKQEQIDYQGNLNIQNGSIQQFNNDNWNAIRRGKVNKGVEAQKAY